MKTSQLFPLWLKEQRSILFFLGLFAMCFNAILLVSSPLSKSLMDILYLDALYLVFWLVWAIYKFIHFKSDYEGLFLALDQGLQPLIYHLPEGKTPQLERIRSVAKAVESEHLELEAQLVKALSQTEDYASLWVHEMKTPIAILQMNIEHLTDLQLKTSLEEEVQRINHLAEQFLYYSRSNDFTKDYLVQELALDKLGTEIVKKHSKSFISKAIQIHLDLQPLWVLSDKKWLGYILEQGLVNAIQYSPKGSQITLSMTSHERKIIFKIEDQGLGISQEDLPRVFDRGFTGSIGRSTGSSTGMGLYLAKQLSLRLGHKLSMSSQPNQGTCFQIEFLPFSDERSLTKV